jgi:hypothetical protein
LGHYYVYGDHRPGRTSVWDEFQQNRSLLGFDREVAAQTNVQLAAQLFQQALGSSRGAIGTPAQLREFLRSYEEAGVDQVVFVSQAGRNRHEYICESLELFAREVMPEFAESRSDRERSKAERLTAAIESALARRAPPRSPPEGYSVRAAFQA